MTDLEIELYETLKQMTEIAKSRWRSLPVDSPEKKVLDRAEKVFEIAEET